ncbi:PE-PPE domain-containing protein [[Mycobacterium] kokjensenii]|uniref:PE-PPE domain-containing protein n=1 Tax=[Mycobacterium] kokjensenii TaxID=3064287 RepID=A0ABN9N8T0_9MYCO|nr:PE-PPE domain-containing protein [Mycolicibacter sp. MU0083]CAJ1502218.1 PE-PPE domain-containing protein [Mycolicibacter sp. MU0083]
MGIKRMHPLGAGLSAVLIAAASPLIPAAAVPAEKLLTAVGRDLALLGSESWIMTGTGTADPTIGDYMDLVRDYYLQPATPWFPGQTTYPGYELNGLVTPEQFCPIVCQPLPVPQVDFGESLAQGLANLQAAILPQLEAGDDVTVFGFSQSSVIATLAMHDLLAGDPSGDSLGFDPDNLHFVLIGAPNNPISGILTRLHFPDGFDGDMQRIPFLNIPMGIESTPTGPFTTDVYATEYDGWAVFPQDPTNLLAVINALMGIGAVHNSYFQDNLANVIELGSIGNTDYYMLPEQLPILGPVYGLGDFGKVLGDALTPLLKLYIDWSYGNPGAPDAGISVDGVDPIGAAGAWAVTATGQLSHDTDAAGFLLRMDPLQMLAGLQYAAVHTLVDPINDLLGFAGQDPLSQDFVDALLTGYHFTLDIDQMLLTGWHDLATEWDLLDVLGPDAVFNGAPLLSAQPLLDLIGVGFSLAGYLDS